MINIRGKEGKYLKLDLRGRRLRRLRKDWGQFIGELERDRGIEFKNLKIPRLETTVEKWINGSMQKGNRGR